jgi:hypothetical protein
VVSADRGSSKSNLGAAIVVELPPSFDSDLTIDKGEQPGDVALEFLGNTRNLNVDMNALGADLHVADATNLLRATINTDGEIQITDGFASLEAAAVHSAFGDIGVRFKAVPVSHARVLADFGDLTVILPGDGDFTLTGTAERGVSTGNAPAGCSSSSSPSPKSMECNAGDPDGLTFELRASGEIQLGYE